MHNRAATHARVHMRLIQRAVKLSTNGPSRRTQAALAVSWCDIIGSVGVQSDGNSENGDSSHLKCGSGIGIAEGNASSPLQSSVLASVPARALIETDAC